MLGYRTLGARRRRRRCTATRRGRRGGQGRRRNTARAGAPALLARPRFLPPPPPGQPIGSPRREGAWSHHPPGADWRLPRPSRCSPPARSPSPRGWGRAAPACEGARLPRFGHGRWGRGGGAAGGSRRSEEPRGGSAEVLSGSGRAGLRPGSAPPGPRGCLLRGAAPPPPRRLPQRPSRLEEEPLPVPPRRFAPRPPTPRLGARQVTPALPWRRRGKPREPPAVSLPLCSASDRGGVPASCGGGFSVGEDWGDWRRSPLLRAGPSRTVLREEAAYTCRILPPKLGSVLTFSYVNALF